VATVMVFHYEYTDGNMGNPARGKRMGTKEYIESVHAWIVGSGFEVDASKVDAAGKTEMGFDPQSK
jgi:hypothetical protein